MNRLAVIDIDGVVCDSEERFAKSTNVDGSINWRIALSATYVHLDTLIEGVNEALSELEQRGNTIVFLTSRPDAMRLCTLGWLDTHKVDYRRLVMRPQFAKTKEWKAKQVGLLALEYQADGVMLVEDEQANADAIIAGNPGLPIVWFESLAIRKSEWNLYKIFTRYQW